MFADINLIKSNHIVGVQDNVDQPGKFIINELISSNQADCDIHVFCYDQYCEDLKNELSVLTASNVHFHDCLPNRKFVDPLGSFLSSLNVTDGTFRKIVIILDSLSTLLLLEDFDDVYRTLRQPVCFAEKSCRAQIQIVALIHEDTLINRIQSLKHLRYLCRVWVQVGADSLIVTLRKTSGRIQVQKYDYELTDGAVKIQKKTENSSKGRSDAIAASLPSSTFKLNLSEDEKKARDAVQLPYEKNESTQSITKGAEIFYEPDDCDDWDEEDPDNDLEFS
ncbi:hypothetical protein V9T40_002212 [Parthenolecanium corni]|uniref:Elongator complex protein 5 n=1 Tax=Parthenolecanium corni TaxID=536013 RepID=A0AAN9Y3Z1_9HEMI